MFKIAVCDDNRSQCNEIENIIVSYFMTESLKYEIDIYFSGEEFINNLNAGEKYDLVYLDIELALLDGVFVGQYIREELRDDNIQIVYISGKASYALDLFQSRPMHFLIKPLSEQQIIQPWKKLLNCKVVKQKFWCIKQEKVYVVPQLNEKTMFGAKLGHSYTTTDIEVSGTVGVEIPKMFGGDITFTEKQQEEKVVVGNDNYYIVER